MSDTTIWQRHAHLTAVLQALLVTFIWALSWVLIKIGLTDIPPLIFAGLRYFLAFLILVPLVLRPAERQQLRRLPPRRWLDLLVLGIVFYALTQGAQFFGLAYLPAVTLNLMLGLTTVAVALLGRVFLAEGVTGRQWLGIVIAVAGLLLYFYPVRLPAEQRLGLMIGAVAVLANAISSILGRAQNRSRLLSPLAVTVVSMGIGSIIMLLAGIVVDGWPALGWRSWALIAWLAVVHTAFTFTLWNHTLRTLPAVESSIINNTMGIQIPILAVVFLGETITGQELAGLVVAIIGTLIVQFGRKRGG